MDRVYQSNAVGTPPAATPSSGAYPTAGNKSVGQLATVPGPYWFYSITEEIRNAIVAAGLTPDPAQVNQLASAMAKFLPLSGGTMTGTIKTAGDAIIGKTDSSYLSVFGGTNVSGGASLELNGKIRSDVEGHFRVVARDDSNAVTLHGKPDGSLTWGGKNVITSAGGTFTGTIEFSAADGMIRKPNANTRMVIRGSNAFEAGGSLYLNGKDYSSNSGGFQIYAHDGATSRCLLGLPSGALTWDKNRLVTMPNYSAGISIATSIASYTAPSDGYLMLFMQFDEINIELVQIKVNNVVVGGYRNWAGAWSGNNVHITLPLSKGDVVTGLLTNTNANIKANVKTFFPMKGA